MMTENKRDLAADLAICEAATAGPVDYFESIDSEYEYEVCRKDLLDTIIASVITDQDARFIAEAFEGWPEAIRRAIAAEAEVERLRNGVIQLRDSISADLDAARSSAYITDCTFVHENRLEDMLRKIERYIPLEVTADVAE